MLAAPLERSQSTIFFSATLLPLDYFSKLLTGATDYPKRVFQTPFPVENVRLLIHNRISTKYKHRADSYAPIASAIETICGAHLGNYLVFFPSYDYLTQVLELVRERLPEEQLLVQDRGMTETERETFLDQFSKDNLHEQTERQLISPTDRWKEEAVPSLAGKQIGTEYNWYHTERMDCST